MHPFNQLSPPIVPQLTDLWPRCPRPPRTKLDDRKQSHSPYLTSRCLRVASLLSGHRQVSRMLQRDFIHIHRQRPILSSGCPNHRHAQRQMAHTGDNPPICADASLSHAEVITTPITSNKVVSIRSSQRSAQRLSTGVDVRVPGLVSTTPAHAHSRGCRPQPPANGGSRRIFCNRASSRGSQSSHCKHSRLLDRGWPLPGESECNSRCGAIRCDRSSIDALLLLSDFLDSS